MEGLPVLCAQSDPGWLRLVREHPAATAFHLPGWSQVITETYGYPAFVLMQRDGERAVAGIPVVEVSNPLGRRRLVALPYTDHCPPLVEDGGDFLAALEGRRGLEIRTDLTVPGAERLVVGTRHLLDLEPDPEAVFRRLHRNRIQRRVRRSRELGVTVSLGRDAADVDTFYLLHCDTRRRQGVPVQPRRFIENIWRLLIQPGNGFVVTARLQEKPIATALFLAWNRHLIYKFGASDSTHWNLGANFLVHWTAMEWGCRNGYAQYDFGRTDAGHESLRAFKALWGTDEVPLTYTYIGSAPPRAGQGRASRAMAQVIRRSPTLVCRALGEMLYRYAA